MITLDELRPLLSVDVKVLHDVATLDTSGKARQAVDFLRWVLADPAELKALYQAWVRTRPKGAA